MDPISRSGKLLLVAAVVFLILGITGKGLAFYALAAVFILLGFFAKKRG